MTNPTTPDEELDDSFCPSLNGLGPHNYQPVIDLTAGTGMWMYCNQCGDYFQVDGTAPQGPLVPPTAPTGGSGTAPTPTRPSFP